MKRARRATTTAATIDDEFVKFVIAAAIERSVAQPLQAAAAAAAAARGGTEMRRCDAAFVCVTSDRISDAHHNFERLEQSLDKGVAFPATSTTAVYTSHRARLVLWFLALKIVQDHDSARMHSTE